eukprot:2799526-Rhodomonas_salina.4
MSGPDGPGCRLGKGHMFSVVIVLLLEPLPQRATPRATACALHWQVRVRMVLSCAYRSTSTSGLLGACQPEPDSGS